MELIKVLAVLAQMVSLCWQMALCAAMVGRLLSTISSGGGPRMDRLWRAFARVHQELWIAAPPGLIAGAAGTWHSKYSWMIISFAVALWQWWAYRDWPDENRWKRRGRKLKDAVAERAGRLVVVPSHG
jgi:hypothetical protein